ncbi:DEAD/DEAH box helicase [Candidatus Uabimicrobium amorphum]|uniref:ATP-dependent RNA helicase RhlE n=1 Tax=Uabimicrobium amorphum TaxID=2596890 RepID=A0A5S9F2F8_UABAM|nr:DEAD/DEAH box helicase [Candidatus Uabimicrobium amorphum]BBM83073.1 ATP-dependent RNA helicase RhlE [Candidatus Uabimicrobium amorphum]
MKQTNTTFNNYNLTKNILKDIAAMGFKTPTSIQAKCIPPALDGKDIIGLAQTGTGKTAAFALPIIQKVAHNMDMAALVLAPTRELAQQIAQTITNLGKSSGARVALLVGGTSIKEDSKALGSWPNILVATPGRLIDHIFSRTVDLSKIEILTIDEADHMHDMGFLPQIQQIIDVLPKKRQTMMFTATMSKKIEHFVRRSMHRPKRIEIGRVTPATRAEQKLFRVNEDEKLLLLMDLLSQKSQRILIFARTKRKVDQLARRISALNKNVARLHGDYEQSQREMAMEGFRNGKYNILVATDIAARGIDVANIEHVINYDFPSSAEDYIHRIGRTARATSSGLATSFVTRSDLSCLKHLEKMISSKLKLIHVGSENSKPYANKNRKNQNKNKHYNQKNKNHAKGKSQYNPRRRENKK